MHLKLVKAHLVVLELAGQTEVNLIKTVPPLTPRIPTKETGAVSTAPRKVRQRRAKTASAAKKRDSTDEPEVVFVSGGRASSSGAKMASPPEVKEKWACPIDECRESAVHPLDS